MENKKSRIRKKLFVFLIFFILGSLFLIRYSQSQTNPDLMITWRANNYVPSNYEGKILPTPEASVNVSLEIINNGRMADISKNEIRWLVNSELKSGIGLKNIEFSVDRFKNPQKIRVTIMNFNGSNLEKTIFIPVAEPETVITGGPNTFQALPYFFNINNLQQLSFIWSANGLNTEGQADNPDILNLDTSQLPAGAIVNLRVQIQNSLKPLEISSQKLSYKL